MRKFGLLMISVAGMVVAGTAALADAAPPPAAPAAATDASVATEANKMVCRTMTAPTGTRIGARRECRTQREWDDIRQQSQKETDQMQGNRGIAAPGKQ